MDSVGLLLLTAAIKKQKKQRASGKESREIGLYQNVGGMGKLNGVVSALTVTLSNSEVQNIF